jgi:hypothetical protein
MGSRSLLAMLKKKEKNRERRTKEKGKPETEKKNSYHCHGLSKLLLLLESIPRNKEEQEASQQKKQKEDVVERGIQTKKKKKNGHIELHSQAACHHRKHQACGTEMVPNSVHSTVVAHLEKTYLNLQHHQNNTGAFKSRNRDESNPAKLAL